LNTDTCIAIIKGHSGAIKKLRGKSIGQVGISAITLSELNFGAAKSSRSGQAIAALAEFTIALEIASIDAEISFVYGSVR
ncbi:type II toxin-antitoxin system VapC family toxin, partial [Acinetobacter baumannii]